MGAQMGLKDAVFDEARKQFIARPDERKNQTLFKWPHTNIRLGTQVTVQPDELAYFVNKGEVVGHLQNGQFKLDGADIPFVGRFIDRVTDGDYLISELYFVSTRTFTNNKFGGSMGQVTDPDTKLAVALGIHGAFGFRAFDADRLVMNLVGTRGIDTNDELVQLIRDEIVKHARAILNGSMRSKEWDLTQVTDGSLNVQFEPEIVAEVNSEIDQYGLTMTGLQDFAVSVTDDSWEVFQEITRRRANMQLAGQDTWVPMAQGEMMLGAAQGLTDGTAAGDGTVAAAAGAGIGAGLGLGMARRLAGEFSEPSGEATAQTASLTCPKCGARSPGHAKFCVECGAPVTRLCAECGAILTGAFCSECGSNQAHGERSGEPESDGSR